MNTGTKPNKKKENGAQVDRCPAKKDMNLLIFHPTPVIHPVESSCDPNNNVK